MVMVTLSVVVTVICEWSTQIPFKRIVCVIQGFQFSAELAFPNADHSLDAQMGEAGVPEVVAEGVVHEAAS